MHPTLTEVAIIGGGPIGIELAIAFQRLGVDYKLFEAKQIGNEFTKWPPHTHFFSTNEHIALGGIPIQNMDQQSITGEAYLAYLRMVVEIFDLTLHTYEPVEKIDRTADNFMLTTSHRTGVRTYQAKYVVVAMGNMDKPRLLNIPGENLPHVTHYFPGPHPYFRNRLLIVGGKNSAIEAALRCWRAGVDVAHSYRRSDFDWDRIKPHLSGDIQDRHRKNEIKLHRSTIPVKITPSYVELATTDDGMTPTGKTIRHFCDFVLLATGFVANMSLLHHAGVQLNGTVHKPTYDPETMESNVSGLFIAGTTAGGTQTTVTHYITTSHIHVERIVKAITGQTAGSIGTISSRNKAVTADEVKAN